jgi:hypothetical protein
MGDYKPRHFDRAQTLRGLISGDFTSRIYPYGPREHLRAIVRMLEWSDARARALELREAIRRARPVNRWRLTMRPVEAVARSTAPRPAIAAPALGLSLGRLLGLGLVHCWRRAAASALVAPGR